MSAANKEAFQGEKVVNGINFHSMTVKAELLAVETFGAKKEEIMRDVVAKYEAAFPVTGKDKEGKEIRALDWQNFLISQVADELPQKDGKVEPWAELTKRQSNYRLFGFGPAEGGFTDSQSAWYRRINSAKTWRNLIMNMDKGNDKKMTRLGAETKAAQDARDAGIKEGLSGEQLEGKVRAAVRKAGEAFRSPKQPQAITVEKMVAEGPDKLRQALSLSLKKMGQPEAVLSAGQVKDYIREHPVEVMEDFKALSGGNPAISALCDSIIAMLKAGVAPIVGTRPEEQQQVVNH